MGPRQAATAHGVSDAAQVVRHRIRQVGQGLQDQQVLGQHIEQQFARTVGKGVQPLTDSRAGRTGFGQLAQQVFPTQPAQKVQGNDVLQQAHHIVAKGMKEIGQQAMGTTTDLAAEPLNPQTVILTGQACPTQVDAPTNQRASGLAVGVRTTAWNGEGMPWEGNGLGIIFDGTGKMQYNDHVVGDTSPTWLAGKRVPRWEVSSFLQRLPAIIAGSPGSVNPGGFHSLAAAPTDLSIIVAVMSLPGTAFRGSITLFGREGACFDQRAWPVTATLTPTG